MEYAVPPYPDELSELPGRELARLSQTNVTADVLSGLEFGFAAFDKGLQETESDPTLASEAAAKVGFRYAQQQDLENVDEWFRRADVLLPDTPAGQREEIANRLLQGRALGFMALHADSPLDRRGLFARATAAFNSGQFSVTKQHQSGESWDPYATMLSRHHATVEAIKPGGQTRRAAKIALNGIARAIHSRVESANSPEVSRAQKVQSHAKFVGKQIMMNAAALSLAVTRPLGKRSGKIEQKRRFLAEQLLG